MEGQEQVKPYPRFSVRYRVGDDVFEAIIQAKNFLEAQRHVNAMMATAKLDGKLS